MKLLELKPDLQKRSGVYIIECNSHKYVGSSIDLYKRYKHHCNQLIRNSHYNDFLQKIYNKHAANMTFRVIEFCNDYIEKETYYIEYFDCDVNVERNPITREKSSVTKEKLRMANKNKRLGKENHASVTVYQYTLDGDYVNEYASLREAATAINGDATSIGDAVKGDYKSSGGFQWRKDKLEQIPSISKRNRKPYWIKNLIILDETNAISFKSIKEAALYLNAKEGTVRKALAKGFKCKGKVIKLEL
jgi:group I intron endonuclease